MHDVIEFYGCQKLKARPNGYITLFNSETLMSIIISIMSNPKYQFLSQDVIDKEPFLHMNIDSSSILDTLENRSPCPECFKSRKYFCYTCCVPITELTGKLPQVKLPIKIDIIKHKNEIDGKSTAIHAAILSPGDVKIYTYPDIPDYSQDGKTVLIFPSNSAISITELFHKCLYNVEITRSNVEEEAKGFHKGTLLRNRICSKGLDACFAYTDRELPIERAVFIDSTWNQSKGIYKDSNIRQLPCVVLQNRVSQFWRHQKNSPRWYLATVEAIHQFVVEMHINAWGYDNTYKALRYIFHDISPLDGKAENSLASNGRVPSYNGQYDNLLFFFKYMHNKIHAYYDHSMLKAYQRPML